MDRRRRATIRVGMTARFHLGRRGRAAALVAAILLLLLLVVAMFPWGSLRGVAERRLSDRIGAPVRIALMTRTGWFGLHPVVRLQDVTVAQPEWAGKGDLLRLRAADIRFSALAALIGRFQVEAVSVDGARAVLIRDATGRKNWTRGHGDDAGPQAGIAQLTMQDSRISYRDALRERNIDAQVVVDATGLRAAGKGSVRGAAITLEATGAPLASGAGGWPFTARIRGSSLSMTVDDGRWPDATTARHAPNAT